MRKVKDNLLRVMMRLSAALVCLLLAALIGYVFMRGLPGISWSFLTGTTSYLKQTTGILPNILNTLYIILVTMVIAVPLGVCTAIYLTEYARNKKLVRLISFATETLTGIPSILFGLVGMLFFLQLMGLKAGILAGGLTLSIMVLPTIISNTKESLQNVPQAWRDGALALGSAENALQQLSSIKGKKSEDYMALLAAILYNLAVVHNGTGDNSRAAKELTKAQQLLERLVKKNEMRFSVLLLNAVEASTDIITSRTKQMNVLAHYQTIIDANTVALTTAGSESDARRALMELVDTLRKEGEIMLLMGNSRNAVKYYTKALRYQKKLNEPLGMRDLTLSIGLAKALMRLINRRAAAEQLLTSLLPLARRLGAANEASEIENLLNSKTKNYNIMTLLKGIF